MISEQRKEPEINLSVILAFFRRNKWIIAGSGLLMGIGGYLYSLQQPIEYTSSAKILPELQNKNGLGGFRALADLAGISVDNVQITEAIRPDLYPNVLSTKVFLLKLSQLEIQPKDQKGSEALESYLEKQAALSKGISLNPLRWFKLGSPDKQVAVDTAGRVIPRGVLFLSKKKDDMLKGLGARVGASLDKKSGIISVDVTMPDPLVSAVVANFAVEYLIQYMSEYRTGKENDQVRFLQKEVERAQSRFKAADRAVRVFADRNRNPFLSKSTSEEGGLQAELQLSQKLFNELSYQLEQAKLKEGSDAAVIQVLDPPQIPLERSSPKRAITAALFLIVGLVLSTMTLAVRAVLRK